MVSFDKHQTRGSPIKARQVINNQHHLLITVVQLAQQLRMLSCGQRTVHTQATRNQHRKRQGQETIVASTPRNADSEQSTRHTNANQKRRSKRAVAKSVVYKTILSELQELRTNFNVGISTGTNNDPANKWRQSYRHWNFISSNREDNDNYQPKNKRPK